MADVSPDKTSGGCGMLYAVFGKNKFWPRRSASAGSIPSKSSSSSKRRRNSFQEDDIASVAPNIANDDLTPNVRPPVKASQPQQQKQQMPRSQNQHQYQQQQHQQKQHQHQHQQMGMVRGENVSQGKKKQQQQQVGKGTLGISGELESMIAEQQRGKGYGNGNGNAGLMRASSGNVMLYGHLGNLRQPTANNHPNNIAASASAAKKYGNSVMGNIVKNNNNNLKYNNVNAGTDSSSNSNSLCRAISCRMDPEELKMLGNEDYKNGRFAEALALYERAIDIDPSKASYRSNKSAALTALGRLLEAIFECTQAIQIDPHYHRAHHRLANLYLRLGDGDKALYHFKQAGPDADPDTMAKAKLVSSHLNKCDQAKRIRDWNAVIKATNNAISAGADSAPTILSLQAEALLRLHRHQEAELALNNGPRFDIQQSTKFFGPAGNAALLLIRAQVDMACGRFEDAITAAERAGQLDPSNREVNPINRRARSIASARAHGNQLFKTSKFSEASSSYSEGLEHDPYNSVLLCNRAACRSKLGHYDKAIDDCNAALKVRPSYNKARLRRADCNSKLGKWEIAIQDYEMLMRETPGDEEVGRALFEAQIQLKKQQGEDVSGLKFGENEVVAIQSNERFKHFISLPGLAVVLFCKKPEKHTLGFMDQLCKRYPTIKFLKVEVEDLASIATSEGVISVPTLIIYKNGSRVKEVAGDDHELLESSIKEYAA